MYGWKEAILELHARSLQPQAIDCEVCVVADVAVATVYWYSSPSMCVCVFVCMSTTNNEIHTSTVYQCRYDTWMNGYYKSARVLIFVAHFRSAFAVWMVYWLCYIGAYATIFSSFIIYGLCCILPHWRAFNQKNDCRRAYSNLRQRTNQVWSNVCS